MPRFFLDLDDHSNGDDEALEAADLDAAIRLAIELAAPVGQRKFAGRYSERVKVDIRNIDRKLAAQVVVSLRVSKFPKRPQRRKRP